MVDPKEKLEEGQLLSLECPKIFLRATVAMVDTCVLHEFYSSGLRGRDWDWDCDL